jgi:hypothetical protein
MMAKKFTLPPALIALLLFMLTTILMLKPTLDLLIGPRGQSFDWLPIWAGGHAVLEGEDPYGPEVTRRIQLAVFRQVIPPEEYQHGFSNPAHLAFVLLPLMILPFSLSLLLWLSLQIPLFMVNLLLGLQLLKWPVRPLFLFLLTFLTLLGFRYPINVYVLGQLTFFVIFCMLLSLWLFQQGRPRWAAVALACATIRPDLSLLAILLSVLFLWGSPFRYPFFIALFLAGLVLALLPLFFIGFWPLAWLEELQGYVNNPFATWPPQLLPWTWLRLVLQAGLMAWIGYYLWRAWREPTPFSRSLLVSAALLASLLLLLQTGSYNLTLALVPALILIRYARPTWLKALITLSLLAPWFYFWLGPAFDRLIFLLIPGQFILFQFLVELFPLKALSQPTHTIDTPPLHPSPHASNFPPT